MAGYQPTQGGIYISPDVHIPPGMTAYPMQPPTVPHQQQLLDQVPLPHQQGSYFMLPPSQYRHPAPAAGPQRLNYPYPPPQQQQQQFSRNINDIHGSTTVMLPVTFTPGMAPVIHSATTNNGRMLPPPPQKHRLAPQFPGPPPMNMYTATRTSAGGGGSGGGSGSPAPIAPIPSSPRYLPMSVSPPASMYHHQFAPQPHLSAGNMWQGGGPLRFSPPPQHPITSSGQDFQATMMPSGVTGPLQLPPRQQHQQPQRQRHPAAAAAARVGRAPASQPPVPSPRPEEQSGDSAPPRYNSHGYKSQNNDLAGDLVSPQSMPLPSPAAGAATRPSSLQKTNTAHGTALDALVEAATAAAPEASRASRSSARQQRFKTMKQNEFGLPTADVNGGIGRKPRGGPRHNTSEALRRELGAALLGSQLDTGAVDEEEAAAGADSRLPPPQQQQQQPAVPSSVLQNLSRALADLSRMTANTTPGAAAVAVPAAVPMVPPPAVHPSSGTSAGVSAMPSSLAYVKRPPEAARFLPPALPPPPPPPPQERQQQQQEQELPPPSLPAPNTSKQSTEKAQPLEEVVKAVESGRQCPACGKLFLHRTSKGRHMKNCKAVALGLVFTGTAQKLPKQRKKCAPPSPVQPPPPSPPPTAPPPPRPRPPPLIVPIIQPLPRPANGPKVSQPLKLEKIYFGPGIYFPRPLKKKRSNIFKKGAMPVPRAAVGAAIAAPSLYGQQQQGQLPMMKQPDYVPLRPVGAGAPIAFQSHQPQQYAPLLPSAVAAAAAPTTAGAPAVVTQGQWMQLQQNRTGGMPFSLPNVPIPPFATTRNEQLHVPPPSPQPAPSRLQRSAVATTRAEPMVRIVRDISSASQLQRLQVDAKMERSLLLPAVSAPSTTPLTSIQRGAAPTSAAAVAVALAVSSDLQQPHTQRYPDEFTPLFKLNLTIIDESDQAWPVTYEGLACSGQRHVRLSSGWHALMKGVGVIPGDKVVLERWTDDRTVLHMLVLEGSEEQRAAAAAGGGAGDGTRKAQTKALPPPPFQLEIYNEEEDDGDDVHITREPAKNPPKRTRR